MDSFNLLNECADKNINYDNNLFNFYNEMLDLINHGKCDEKIKILIILKNFCQLSGINLKVNQCVVCGAKQLKTINFKFHGMLCNICTNKNHQKSFELEISKVFYYLFTNQYELLNQFCINLNFAIKLLRDYIVDNLGIFLESLKNF